MQSSENLHYIQDELGQTLLPAVSTLTSIHKRYVTLFNTVHLPIANFDISVTSYTYDRLDKNDTLLLICDIEEGLYLMARDHHPVSFRTNFLAHAALGRIFTLPTVIASVGTSGSYSVIHLARILTDYIGPNGPIVPEILQFLPNATVFERPGEISPWDDPIFRHAVMATGKKQAVIAGIVTDVSYHTQTPQPHFPFFHCRCACCQPRYR